MSKERTTLAWEGENEEVRRLFTLTPDDLYFLRPIRADAQRLYRALVLLWARNARVLLAETSSIPEAVIKQVSKQLGLTPAVLSHLRNPPMMRSATFEAVRTYLGVRTLMNAAGSRVVPDDAPVDFVPKKWTSVVLKDGEVNKHGWEFTLLHEARTALRAGDLTVSGSQRYAAWDSDLYQSDVWASRRDAWYSEQGLPRDGESFLSDSLDQLHRQTQRVAKRIARHKNLDACVEGEKLKLTALEKVELPQEVSAIRTDLVGLFPLTGLPELLMEVNRWTPFARELTHLTGRRQPSVFCKGKVNQFLREKYASRLIYNNRFQLKTVPLVTRKVDHPLSV